MQPPSWEPQININELVREIDKNVRDIVIIFFSCYIADYVWIKYVIFPENTIGVLRSSLLLGHYLLVIIYFACAIAIILFIIYKIKTLLSLVKKREEKPFKITSATETIKFWKKDKKTKEKEGKKEKKRQLYPEDY